MISVLHLCDVLALYSAIKTSNFAIRGDCWPCGPVAASDKSPIWALCSNQPTRILLLGLADGGPFIPLNFWVSTITTTGTTTIRHMTLPERNDFSRLSTPSSSPCQHASTSSVSAGAGTLDYAGMASNSIKLLTGNSHPELAKAVAARYVDFFPRWFETRKTD